MQMKLWKVIHAVRGESSNDHITAVLIILTDEKHDPIFDGVLDVKLPYDKTMTLEQIEAAAIKIAKAALA